VGWSGAVVLNSGRANACHRARRVPGHARDRRTRRGGAVRPRAARAAGAGLGAGEVAVCSTGLIGERLPMDVLAAPGWARRPTRCPSTVDPARRRGHHDHRHAVPKTAVVAGATGTRSGGMAKGAGNAGAGAGDHAWWYSRTDAVADGRYPGRRPLARRDQAHLRPGLDSDGCMSTKRTPCCCCPAARPGRPRRFRS